MLCASSKDATNQMKTTFGNVTVTNQRWELENISISHNIVDYNSFEKNISKDHKDVVRLHFGLGGNYVLKHLRTS